MDATPQQPEERDGVISSLNLSIQLLDLAKEVASIIPAAKTVFHAVSILLVTIKVCFSSAGIGRPLANVNRPRWLTDLIVLNWG